MLKIMFENLRDTIEISHPFGMSHPPLFVYALISRIPMILI